MSRDFETATKQIHDVQQQLDLFIYYLASAAAPLQGSPKLEALKLKGYRFDLRNSSIPAAWGISTRTV